jgi:hypothetical protein
MSSNPIFTPVQTTESVIKNLERQNGWLYFATDTGRMYLDTETDRISVGGFGGGGGASIYYGDATEPPKDETTEHYSIAKNDVSNTDLIKEGDLILNSDGGFYKVESITEEYYICTLLSVSGTNSGPVVSEKKPTIKFTINNTNLINGQEAYFTVEGKSALEDDGVTPVDTDLYVTYALGTRISQSVVNNYY